MSADDQPLSRSDLRLVEQAFRAAWPMSAGTRMRLLRTIAALALRKNTADRTRIRAFLAILAADRLNVAQAKLDLARLIFEDKGAGDDAGTLAELVAQAEAAVLAHKPAERPEGK